MKQFFILMGLQSSWTVATGLEPNPRQKNQKPRRSNEVTVWFVVISNRIIGPFFYDADDHLTVTVNTIVQCWKIFMNQFLDDIL